MCGIAGLVRVTPAGRTASLEERAGAMADTLRHRGPDDGDVWSDAAAGVALSHRRLSIVDLSPLGRQPMISGCGRMVISYNGEVYNAPELAAELEAAGRRPRGHSDTAVVLEACAQWGVRAATTRFIGMFAFALWDRAERRLWLVRDRLGIKPLYWRADASGLMFASELKALRACDGWTPTLRPDALAGFMRHGYVPAPHTIYSEVWKLEPGCLLSWLPAEGTSAVPERYWDLDEVIAQARGSAAAWTDAEAVDALDSVLRDAVRRRMAADVPLGAFLSGGIDSSTVVALMQDMSSRPVRTFSIGFDEAGYDEAIHARKVASHLGTHHTELYVDAGAAMDVIPAIPDMYDEPFADASQIPTFLVSRMTREHVTVSLSGDGGDELFAGYNRYLQAGHSLPAHLLRFPAPLRYLGAGALGLFSPSAWDRLLAPVTRIGRIPQLGDKLHKFAAILREGRESMYLHLVSHWHAPGELVCNAREVNTRLWDDTVPRRYPDDIERMQVLDTLTYLPDDILTKLDRASMAVSLEARVPLLDHRVVAFAWSLPRRFKLRDGRTKWILRELLHRHVPSALVERPKMGFGIPLNVWLRGPLREWAEDLLEPDAMAADGILDPAPVQRVWREHQSGRMNRQYALWNVLMFQAWKRRWLP